MDGNIFSFGKFKKIIFSKEYRNLVVQIFKKEYKKAVLMCFLVLLVIGIGQIIAVVGSRKIIEPISIVTNNLQKGELQSFKAIMQLSRSDNYSLMINNAAKKESKEYWFVASAFIKKIIIVISKADLTKLESIDITIGNKKFNFTNQQLVKNWANFDQSVVSPFLTDTDRNNLLVLEVPSEVSLVKSRIPFYKVFFGSLINWSGDNKILGNSIKNTIFLWLLIMIFLLILRLNFVLFKFYPSYNNISEDDLFQAKRQFILCFFVVVSTVGVIVLLNSLIYFLYTPNVADILREASTLYISRLSPFLIPKPVERMQFMLSVLMSPFIIYLFYYLFDQKFLKTNQSIDRLYQFAIVSSIFLISVVVYFGLAMSNFFFIQDSYYFSSIGKYLYSLFIFPLVLSIFLMKDKTSKKINAILIISICLSLVTIFFINIVDLSSACNSNVFDPVIYPVSQVVAGKSLLVNLTSLYGLYPFFIAPIFKIIGLSVLKFSFLMSSLIVFSLCFLFMFMRQVIKNNLILLLGFLNVVFYSLLATRLSPEYYFQYWPIRFLFPCLGLFLMAIYFKKENKYIYYFSFLIYSVGVLWNFDAGVIVFLSWLMALFYHELTRKNSCRMTVINMVKHLAVGFFAFVFVIGYFVLSTYAISGKLPIFSLFLQYQKIFLSGYLMVKMLLPPHTWNMVVLVYLIGLFLSVRSFIKKQIGYVEEMVFVLTIMGIGLFSYYEGQSLDVSLFRVSYPALILIVIFSENLYQMIKKWGVKIYGEAIIFICLFYIILSAPFNLLYNSKNYFGLIMSGVSNFSDHNSACSDNVSFLKQHTVPNEKNFILANYNQGIYHAETKTCSAVDVPSIPDIIFPGEMNRIVDFLKFNNESKIFIQKPLEDYNIFDTQIKKILKERYIETAKNENNFTLYQAK